MKKKGARRPRRGGKPRWMKRIAAKRIQRLFRLAETIAHEKLHYANRYVELAIKISMKYNVRIPSHLKRCFCKHCYTYLVPGKNCRVRLRSNRFPHVTITCYTCSKIIRYPYNTPRPPKRGGLADQNPGKHVTPTRPSSNTPRRTE